MHTRLIARSLALLVAVSLPITAQVIPVTGVIQTPQLNIQLRNGANPITIYGPANATIHGLLSETPALPDGLTSYQIATSGPNDFNFSLDGATFTMTTMLDANGLGSLDVTIGGPLGAQDYPYTITLHAIVPGFPAIWFQETQQMTLLPRPLPMSISPYCQLYGQCGGPGGGGGQYTGPGDTVPPNLGGGGAPWQPGLDNCALAAGSDCSLSQANDPLGCGADAETVNVQMYYYNYIGYQCLPNTEGNMGWVTYGELYPLLCSSTKTYIDFVFSPPSERSYEHAINRPVQAIESYCVEWLWMRGCTAVQKQGEIVGTMGHNFDFGIFQGFFNPPSSTPKWRRAHGQGMACVEDLQCNNGIELKTQRVRYRRQCLKDVLDDIKASNPGYVLNSSVLFEFGGTWCPAPVVGP